jgi:DNA repair protein RecO
MSYNIYNTQGIILDSFGIKEADKFFRIFTRELGLIEATAQGIRKIESKNRYGLQDFSISDISLVRGREVWRITNVIPQENLFAVFNVNFVVGKINGKFETLLNVFSLLKQLIHGEERNENLFDLIIDGIDFLKNNDLKNNNLENFEILMKIKILYNLGHFDKSEFVDLLDKNLSLDLVEKTGLEKEKIKREIQKAIKETQF